MNALLFEEYEDIMEVANVKGYEVTYSNNENNQSIYLAYEEDSSSESDMTSEEEYTREVCSQSKNLGRKYYRRNNVFFSC